MAERRRSWYLLHTLAGMSIVVLTIVGGFQVYVTLTDQVPQFDLPDNVWLSIAIPISLCAIALIWLWIRMLIDFFRERPARHPVAWGWALFLGMYLGGFVYFWAVWRPRNKPAVA
jgi:hypothetical protein